jgi:tRNA (mo5U34)-methyltransferase
MREEEVLEKVASVRNWYHRIEVRPGVVTPGVNDSTTALRRLSLPLDCSGLKVLDIGTRDGFFAFELEKRGAEVVAMDVVPASDSGFRVAADLLGSRVRYIQENLYRLSAGEHGTFDIVLFLGVLYHLPDPLGALHLVRAICRDRLFLETHVIDEALLLPDGQRASLASVSPALANVPLMEFYPGDALNRDSSNFWGPNVKCVEGMLEEVEFRVIEKRLYGDRAVFECRSIADAARAAPFRRARGPMAVGNG